MLQAYALMEVLKRLGHSPELLFVQLEKRSIARIPFSLVKRSISKYVLKKNDIKNVVPDWIHLKFNPHVEKYTNYFIEKYINPKTEPIYTERDFNRIVKDKYDAYIVGSDQVWRPKMYRFLNHAFFDFVNNPRARRLSYAASFGVDRWEFSKNYTERYRKQIKKFNAVSVREDSGVELCKKYFECDAVHVLDPTLLLGADDYRQLYLAEKEGAINGDLLCYILDPSADKNELIGFSSEKLSMKPFHVTTGGLSGGTVPTKSPYPTVTSWIKAFDDAKFIITDSYHGCIFSIIFNKPFIAYGNKGRGMARFESLLRSFGVESRLISFFDKKICSNLLVNFDGKSIAQQLSKQQDYSLSYLVNNLCQKTSI